MLIFRSDCELYELYWIETFSIPKRNPDFALPTNREVLDEFRQSMTGDEVEKIKPARNDLNTIVVTCFDGGQVYKVGQPYIPPINNVA